MQFLRFPVLPGNAEAQVIMAALSSRCGHYIFVMFLLSSFTPPNLSRRRLDVYHTYAHGVVLVRI